MNPYAGFLENRNANDVIQATTEHLSRLVHQLGPDGMERATAPGKWSARAILCHLADCEVVFAFRLRQALAEPRHVIQPFDQDLWAEQYANLDSAAALAVFSAVRQWNLALLATVQPEKFAKMLNHPERGDMTFQAVVETMGGHDLNHLRQLEAIVSQVSA